VTDSNTFLKIRAHREERPITSDVDGTVSTVYFWQSELDLSR